ncbi:MAG: hypothetical protein KF814_10820 [Nitrospiraceae bacterium]|nr:hypothetical protein [Nitrospiraceae bacterium]
MVRTFGRSLVALSTLGGLFVMVGTVWADCVDGVREATQAELAFAVRAEAALAAALPAPIPSSERRGAAYDFTRQPKLSFCKADPEGSFSPAMAGGYLYKFPKAEADRLYGERKAIEKQIEALETLPPEENARYKELLAQMRSAYDGAPRRSRKDPPFTAEQQAQVERANTEGRKLEAAANKVVADHKASVVAQADQLRAQAKKLETFPQEFLVRLAINVDRFPEASSTTETVGTPSVRRSAGLAVHNVVVAVEGPEGGARQAIFDAIDKAYLKSLVGQPLPEVEASKARAERGGSGQAR